jgi:predicted ABC-type ATPase
VNRPPRMRIVAGPNGSGKSSLLGTLRRLNIHLGVYLNADDLQAALTRTGEYTVENLRCYPSHAVWMAWCAESPGRRKLPADDEALLQRIFWDSDGRIRLRGGELPVGVEFAYVAATVIDFLREWLLQNRFDFSFETVMSDARKIEFLQECHERGYRTYLYFVCTESPELNVLRVRTRRQRGGHDVPDVKIRQRYVRAVANVSPALCWCTRAFFFDNSTDGQEEPTWLAEWSGDAQVLSHFQVEQPGWLARIAAPSGSRIQLTTRP